MNQRLKLSPRLTAAASLVREGAFIADIGTDHAYLPIALCLDGKARGGVVSDINDGPIERAVKNINTYALKDVLTAVKADGLHTIERFAPEDIFILGMGGELIAKITDEAPWTKNAGISLCLQPMTHAEILREFLLRGGYTIDYELLCSEENRIYQLMRAHYTGKEEHYSDIELLLGRQNILRGGEDFCRLVSKTRDTLLARLKGKSVSGADSSYEQKILIQLEKFL